MTIKQYSFILIILLPACNEAPKGTNNTSVQEYHAKLIQLEKAAAEKSTDDLGVLESNIIFNVKRDSTADFEESFYASASIEKPEEDIPKLLDPNEIVIPENKVSVIIDYPLTREFRFELASEKGFSRAMLLREISKNYYKIYAVEESTATIKTIPGEKRVGLYNRNQTNGTYGIWGHDIEDLVLSKILVYRALNGHIILSLFMES